MYNKMWIIIKLTMIEKYTHTHTHFELPYLVQPLCPGGGRPHHYGLCLQPNVVESILLELPCLAQPLCPGGGRPIHGGLCLQPHVVEWIPLDLQYLPLYPGGVYLFISLRLELTNTYGFLALAGWFPPLKKQQSRSRNLNKSRQLGNP